MKKTKLACIMLILYFISSWIYSPAFSSDRINWHTYKDGMELGKKDRKKVFLYFYADWCGYCKDMEKITFKDQSVIDILNSGFIPVRVNTDKEKVTASSYNISGLPSNWFITENGENISNLPGYIPPSKLFFILKYIHTDSYKSMTFKSYLKNLIASEKKQ
ncbi:MAG: thioredoxin fold domain-containing protein [Proteobacteria bacterium]|nr:thioredoxin fold domain-containing protein [Pseudomonadota bacterium]MBU1712659.1 thioredoxin fold domain-containing protein [Pseudomonadota bacterium]